MKSEIILSFLSVSILTAQCFNRPSEDVLVETFEETDSLLVASDSIVVHTQNSLDAYQKQKEESKRKMDSICEVNKKLKREAQMLKETLYERGE